MPTLCEDALTNLDDLLSDTWTDSNRIDAHLDDTLVHINAFEYDLALVDLFRACKDIHSAIDLLGGWYGSSALGQVYYHLRYCGNGLTLGDILAVMLSATNDEYKSFIGIIDAYRVALWNQPFNVDFYAALARGFAE